MAENTVIFIPARLASTRLPNKPLKNLGGIPMILRVWEQALRSEIGEGFVASDNKEIENVVVGAGGKHVLTSKHHSTGTDRIAEALEKVDPDSSFKRIINLQGDLPNICPANLTKVSDILDDSKVDIGTLVTYASADDLNNPNAVKVAASINKKTRIGRALYFSRNIVPANKGKHYYHIGVYSYRPRSLKTFVLSNASILEKREKLEQLRALENGMNISVAFVENKPIGVDTYEDFEKAEKYFNL